MIRVLAISLCFLMSVVFAQESTGFVEEDAHEHGVAQLNIAQDAENLFVEFISPSINIVGFEYQPSSDEEKTLVETALADLEAGLILFSPSETANCELLSASVESEIAAEGHKDDHHEEHGEEGHHEEEHGEEEHHHDEEHSEEGHHEEEHSEEEHHEDEHAEEGHHDEEHGEHEHEHDEAATHSEFHANYEFSCTNADKLTGFDLSKLFALYPAIQDLDVQYALESGQGAAELNPESTKLDF